MRPGSTSRGGNWRFSWAVHGDSWNYVWTAFRDGISLLSERCSRHRIALSNKAPRTPGLFFEDEPCCGLKLLSTFPRSPASSALRTVARSTIRRIDRNVRRDGPFLAVAEALSA